MGHNEALRRPGCTVEPGEQELAGRFPHGERVLGDHRETRLDGVGHHHIVNANERDVVLAPERLECVDRAYRDEVLARQQGAGRPLLKPKQIVAGRVRPPALVELHPHEFAVRCHAVSQERVAIAAQPLACRIDVLAISEEGDAPVPRGHQMVDRRSRRAGVVDQDRVGVDGVRRAIDEDNGHARLEVAQQIGVVALDWCDDEAVHASLTQAVDQLALTRGASALPTKVSTPRVRARSSTPRWIAAKNGLATSSKTRPTLAELRSARRSVLAVRSRR